MQRWRDQEGVAEQEGQMTSQAMAMVNIGSHSTTQARVSTAHLHHTYIGVW